MTPLLIFSFLPAIVCAQGQNSVLEDLFVPNNVTSSQSVVVREGDVCNVRRHAQMAKDPTMYFVCIKPTDDELNWPWKDVGIWMLQKCSGEKMFSPIDRICRTRSHVRRQQQRMCAVTPNQSFCRINIIPCIPPNCPPIQPVQPVQPVRPVRPVRPIQPVQPIRPIQPIQPVQPTQPVVYEARPCPLSQGSDNSGQAGGICSWMLAPLVADTSRNHFLQCAPMSPGLYCGRWIRMPCAEGTVFSAQIQVCVHDENAQPGLPRPVQPIQPIQPVQPVQPVQPINPVQPVFPSNPCVTGFVPLGPCNQFQQCPGFSQCHQSSNSCCQPTTLWSFQHQQS